MNILYIDFNELDLNEVKSLHDMIELRVGKGNLITLPMQTNLLYNVNLDKLCETRDRLNEVIENRMKDMGIREQ